MARKQGVVCDDCGRVSQRVGHIVCNVYKHISAYLVDVCPEIKRKSLLCLSYWVDKYIANQDTGSNKSSGVIGVCCFDYVPLTSLFWISERARSPWKNIQRTRLLEQRGNYSKSTWWSDVHNLLAMWCTLVPDSSNAFISFFCCFLGVQLNLSHSGP